jgi:16S rRNA (uracil1498-N3)-methyltransferase
MSLHRFIFSAEQLAQSPVILTGADWHHGRTLRLAAGDVVLLADGEGKEYQARILKTEASQALLEITGESGRQPEARLAVTLYQGLAKADKLEWVIQKTTELGIRRLVPVISLRSQIKPLAGRDHRQLRWREIARQASRQSGRTKVPEIAEPLSFRQSLAEFHPPDLGLILFEGSGPEDAWKNRVPPDAQSVSLWVGPEGGFALEEVEAARQAGITPVGLGPRILRSETAGIVAAALAMFVWGDLGGGEG